MVGGVVNFSIFDTNASTEVHGNNMIYYEYDNNNNNNNYYYYYNAQTTRMIQQTVTKNTALERVVADLVVEVSKR